MWRLPSVAFVISIVSLVARLVWLRPWYLELVGAKDPQAWERGMTAFMLHGVPDLVLISASLAALKLKPPVSHSGLTIPNPD